MSDQLKLKQTTAFVFIAILVAAFYFGK